MYSIMKQASAYLHEGEVIITSALIDELGVCYESEPYFKIGVEHVEDIGKFILEALEASRPGYVPPAEWKDSAKPLLKLAKERTWGGFVKRSKYISILEESPGVIEIWPSLRGKGGAYHPQIAQKLVSPKDQSEVGANAILAFSQSAP